MKERDMKLRRAIAALATTGLFGFAGTSAADPLTYIPSATDVRFKFVNYEVVVDGLGQELFGLVNITSITNAAGTVTYWNGNGGTDGKQLVGYFENLTSVADQTGGGGLSFTGGNGALYLVPNGTFSPGVTPNTKNYANQLCGGACPAAWWTFDFTPGILDNPGTDATIQAAYATVQVQAGNGFLSITGGTAGAFFDSNGFTFNNWAPADISLRSNFSLASTAPGSNCTPATSAGWSVCSDDPLQGRTVPEPATLALASLGLLGAGLAARRRRKG